MCEFILSGKTVTCKGAVTSTGAVIEEVTHQTVSVPRITHKGLAFQRLACETYIRETCILQGTIENFAWESSR